MCLVTLHPAGVDDDIIYLPTRDTRILTILLCCMQWKRMFCCFFVLDAHLSIHCLRCLPPFSSTFNMHAIYAKLIKIYFYLLFFCIDIILCDL